VQVSNLQKESRGQKPGFSHSGFLTAGKTTLIRGKYNKNKTKKIRFPGFLKEQADQSLNVKLAFHNLSKRNAKIQTFI